LVRLLGRASFDKLRMRTLVLVALTLKEFDLNGSTIHRWR